MVDKNSLKKQFDTKGLYYTNTDLDNVEKLLNYIEKSKESLNNYPNLKEATPFLTVDKGELQ